MMQLKEIIKKRIRNNRGFTLIEVIAVLVILAILTAVAISRGTATDAANLQAEVDTLKAHLRYAQYLAMNDIPPNKNGIIIGSSSYILVKDIGGGPQPSTLNLPNESSEIHSFENGITATGTGTILFDEWGSPDTPIPAIALNGQSITITAETGFIP